MKLMSSHLRISINSKRKKYVNFFRISSLLSIIVRAKCTAIVRLLNFITALWSKYPQDTLKAIAPSFYNDDFTRLIFTCVFNPSQLGFDINNEEINKKLPERVCPREFFLMNNAWIILDFQSVEIDDNASTRSILTTIL